MRDIGVPPSGPALHRPAVHKIGKCLLLLNLPEALVHAVQAADVPVVALPADVDPGWTRRRPRRPAITRR
jgi:hypothetical protein